MKLTNFDHILFIKFFSCSKKRNVRTVLGLISSSAGAKSKPCQGHIRESHPSGSPSLHQNQRTLILHDFRHVFCNGLAPHQETVQENNPVVSKTYRLSPLRFGEILEATFEHISRHTDCGSHGPSNAWSQYMGLDVILQTERFGSQQAGFRFEIPMDRQLSLFY